MEEKSGTKMKRTKETVHEVPLNEDGLICY